MKLLEQFLLPKRGLGEHCGDAVFFGEHFAAVVDGVTPKDTSLFDSCLRPRQLTRRSGSSTKGFATRFVQSDSIWSELLWLEDLKQVFLSTVLSVVSFGASGTVRSQSTGSASI